MNNLRKQVTAPLFSKPWLNHVLAAVLYSFLFVIEVVTPRMVISPLTSLMSLGILACIMRPRYVALWSLAFLPTTFYFLFSYYSFESKTEFATAWLRFATICLGAGGAIFLSYTRCQISEKYIQLMEILFKLPVPVIISDGKGCVMFVNDRAAELLDTTEEDARGASYFSYVAAAEKGRTVQKYFDFLDSKEPILRDVPLNIKQPRPMKGVATLVSIQGNHEKYVATVISTDNTALPHAAEIG